MLYRVAAGTGFRVGELASLSPVNFNLDANPPAIALDAKCSKRRKADVQPIRSELAASLGSWLEGKPAGSPVWPGWWRDQAAEMIRADLRRAKARWTRETQNRKERRKRLESGGLARWAALDLDAGESDGHGAAGLADALHAVRCFADRAHAAGLGDALLAARSRSGRGLHLWLCPPEPVALGDAVLAAAAARCALTSARTARGAHLERRARHAKRARAARRADARLPRRPRGRGDAQHRPPRGGVR